MTRTYLTIVEKTNRHFRSNFILHDGWQWYHSDTNNKSAMMNLLDFFECKIELDRVSENNENGKIEFYNVSKDIISGGGFWNLEQVKEISKGKRIKSFIGLSNGSLVTCYAVFDDEKNTVEILRPNPNAKEVYNAMDTRDHIEYIKNNWVL